MTELHYWTPARGWWVGHADMPPTKADLTTYVTGLNAQGVYRVRIVDGSDVIETTDTACTICQMHHVGHEGSCLL